jgi:Uncharacterized protein conserved in bacteria
LPRRAERGLRPAIRGREPGRRQRHHRTEAVARAPADGNTLLWASTSVIAIFPAISKVGYDPVKDLAPISLFGVAPPGADRKPEIAGADGSGIRRLCEGAKGKLRVCRRRRPGSASNLLMSLFLKRAGLEMTGVSYRGTGARAH